MVIGTWISTLQAQPDKQGIQFCEDVLFDTEFEARPERFCKLWVTAPRLSTFGPGNQHPRVIRNVVKQLNECLPKDRRIEILEPGDESATLKVYFESIDQFPVIAAANGFETVENNWGMFFVNWNASYEIEDAVVLIADDRLRGPRLHHFVLEEITQAMGFPGDSTRIEKSVFYEDASISRFGKATSLSKLDKQLIRFHYRYNHPGDSPMEAGINMAKHW